MATDSLELKNGLAEATDKPKRDLTVDIIKGVAIIIIVMGHAFSERLFGGFLSYIGYFEVAVFFIASGYCFNFRHAKTVNSVGKYLLKRVLTLWLPFALINVILTLFNNVFYNLGLVSEGFLTAREIISKCVKRIFFFGGAYPYAGATWFLRTLFFVSVINVIVAFIFEQAKKKWGIKTASIIYGGILFIFAVGAVLINRFNLKFDRGIPVQSFPCVYLVYSFGILMAFVVKNVKFSGINKVKKTVIYALMFIVSGVAIYFLKYWGSVSIDSGSFTDFGIFIVATVLGWALMWSFAKLLLNVRFIANGLTYIGKKTMPIVLLHFLAFVPVTAFAVLFGADKTCLMQLIPGEMVGIADLWWLQIIYLIVSIAISILLGNLYYFIKGKIISAIKNKNDKKENEEIIENKEGN